MTDIVTQTEEQTAEITLLKQRARLMGIEFSNNIGADTLRQRINEKMDSEKETGPTVSEVAQANAVNPLIGETKPAERELTIREIQQRDELKLVRLRISNLDPKKKELPGEIFTVANEYIGTVRKYVPYGAVTDDGYHVPYIIYRQLEARKFLHIQTTRNRVNGQVSVKHNWAKEFALEILPPLTQDELSALATAQAAAGVFGAE